MVVARIELLNPNTTGQEFVSSPNIDLVYALVSRCSGSRSRSVEITIGPPGKLPPQSGDDIAYIVD